MGLPSGPNSLKRYACERHAQACGRFESIDHAIGNICTSSKQACVVKDGNVMLMGMPTSINTVDEAVDYVSRQILRLVDFADVAIVCFDEPDAVPDAKLEIQRERDVKSKVDQQVDSTIPSSDAYDTKQLENASSIRLLIKQRATRYRAFDELMMRVVQHVFTSLPDGSTEDAPCVAVDGIDPRGASRPSHEPRTPEMFCTRPDLSDAVLQRRTCSIGEADLKLQQVACSLLQTNESASTVAIMDTVDTDSIPISLLCTDVQSRNAYICMRERGVYAGSKRVANSALATFETTNSTASSAAGVLLISPFRLGRSLLEDVVTEEQLSCGETVNKLLFFAACAWAVSGCDFVQPEIGHTNALTVACLQFVKVDVQRVVDAVAAGFSEWDSKGPLGGAYGSLISLLRDVCRIAAMQMNQRLKARRLLQNVEDRRLARSVWTAFYWRSSSSAHVRPLP